jgi:ATP-dependent Zn protease
MLILWKDLIMNDEKSTAYHEAGHALVAYRLDFYGGTITILSDGYLAGSSISESEWADGSRDIEQIIVYYAGFASESKYNKDADKLGSSGDDERAAGLLKFHKETESSLRIKAKELIDKNWPIIEAIAEKLFEYKTLDGDEWSIIIDAFDEGEDWEKCFYKMRESLANFKFRHEQQNH